MNAISPTRHEADRLRLLQPCQATVGPVSLRMLQCDVLEAIVAGTSLDDVALLLCKRVEKLALGTVCSVLRIDAQRCLRPLAGPSIPPALSHAIDGVPIGPEAGTCGSAAHYGHAIETRSIDTDPKWEGYKHYPIDAGLRACWCTPIKGREGQVIGTFAFYFATERGPNALERRIVTTSVDLCALALQHAQLWNQLADSNHRFDLALSHMSQGLCFFDGDKRLIVANRRYAEIYELDDDDVRPGTTLQDIVTARTRAGTGPAMTAGNYLVWRDHVAAYNTPSDTIFEMENGQVIAIHHHPMPDGGWVATHEDITARHRAEAQIVHMARHDALTGLPNRIMFKERLEQALTGLPRGQECAVLCVDLDDFKSVNDTLGHPCGDLLLQQAAERLKACVREGDTVTRFGGDEFAVLLLGIEHPEAAADIAGRIVRSLADPFDLNGHSVVVGASAGIAVAPADGSAAAKLLKSADTALYRAKLDERGSYRFFEPEMDARLQARLLLEQDFRQAVRDQVFTVVYQPIIDLEHGTVCGFEALLRWHHATRGAVPPCEFIPLAEETGLIVPLGAWVLERALQEAASWPAAIRVAVNLSAAQFRDRNLVPSIAAALHAAGIPPARLELEITETVLLRHCEETLATLHQLRRLGVSISLDDFGTAYSSLSYLRSFPFDKIKIDRSFIDGLPTERQSTAIVRAVASLGGSLGIPTTAEGVETQAQLEAIRREGCTQAQGFLFSRGVPAADARQIACASHAPRPAPERVTVAASS